MDILPNGDFVSTVNGTATFTCISTTGAAISEVHWLVNGTQLEDRSMSDIDFDPEDPGTLRLTSIPESYNTTKFQCMAIISGKMSISVHPVLLLLQGEIFDVSLIYRSLSKVSVCILSITIIVSEAAGMEANIVCS